MNITGVEVIRRNPGVAIGVIAGEKIELTYGDTLRVNVSFDYRGLARETTLEGAIGKLHVFPIPRWEVPLKSETTIDIPESFKFTPCQKSIDISITSDIDPGTDYSLHVRLSEYPEAGYPEVDNVITITGIPPTFELIQETIYPYAFIHDGPAETCVYSLKLPPEQITPPGWLGNLIANAFADKIEEQGERVLELRIYADTTPTFWTDYRIEVTGTVPTGGTSGIAFAWAAVIIIVLIILGIIVLTWSITKIYELFFKPKPLTEEIKEAWSRETLIGAINDFEVKLERTPTPPEELEEKLDEELRDYCDQLAEEIVPPVPDMLPLLVLGGLGVLGVGGVAVAYAMSKKPKE